MHSLFLEKRLPWRYPPAWASTMKHHQYRGQIFAILVASTFATHAAENDLNSKIRALDEQTQALKREVLELGRNIAYLAWVGGVKPASNDTNDKTMRYNLKALSDGTVRMGQALGRLEDGVLAPPGVQLVVFVSLENTAGLTLREITLKLDDTLVMRRTYLPEEIAALRAGGAHRLYIGNVADGPHRLTAFVISETEKKKLQSDAYSTEFTKARDRKTVELRIDSLFGNARISSTEWD